jgi:hypothetical protein
MHSIGRPTRDRCYDFKNIFAKKFGEKNWRFLTQNKTKKFKILIIIVAFRERRHFLPETIENRRKL